jgi:hypothetical protein
MSAFRYARAAEPAGCVLQAQKMELAISYHFADPDSIGAQPVLIARYKLASKGNSKCK